ncbi:DoxX family protein [Cohnella rhizosphaerae]|uniref:DoxX family protein n=1 Tax=Cohnella rhizosphaerae TaxID=1457232 RepID=A0A9X4KRC0_9BACL|nr:DoxX family protein [Cohnella rhizosphaerae]MDG0809123.1 DoxX family protein [Cohnella rhizosphaerae]
MNIALWIAQGLLSLGILYAGWMKAVQYEKGAAAWGWVKEVPRSFVVSVGILELLGALGLILPEATGIARVLTPIAAIALAAVVLLGALFHISRREYREIGINVVFLALAVLVAVGRL